MVNGPDLPIHAERAVLGGLIVTAITVVADASRGAAMIGLAIGTGYIGGGRLSTSLRPQLSSRGRTNQVKLRLSSEIDCFGPERDRPGGLAVGPLLPHRRHSR